MLDIQYAETRKVLRGAQSTSLILIIYPVFPWTAVKLLFELLGEVAAVVEAVFCGYLSYGFTGSYKVLAG